MNDPEFTAMLAKADQTARLYDDLLNRLVGAADMLDVDNPEWGDVEVRSMLALLVKRQLDEDELSADDLIGLIVTAIGWIRKKGNDAELHSEDQT